MWNAALLLHILVRLLQLPGGKNQHHSIKWYSSICGRQQWWDKGLFIYDVRKIKYPGYLPPPSFLPFTLNPLYNALVPAKQPCTFSIKLYIFTANKHSSLEAYWLLFSEDLGSNPGGEKISLLFLVVISWLRFCFPWN